MKQVTCDRCGGDGKVTPMGPPRMIEMVLGFMRFDLCEPCANIVGANLQMLVRMDLSNPAFMSEGSDAQPEASTATQSKAETTSAGSPRPRRKPKLNPKPRKHGLGTRRR